MSYGSSTVWVMDGAECPEIGCSSPRRGEAGRGAPGQRARELRRRSTPSERRLWKHLRGRRLLGFKFRRQHPIGPYYADFACLEVSLIVEIDGGQHADAIDYDEERSRALVARGFLVLRFWNKDVLDALEGVVDLIRRALSDTTRRFGSGAIVRARQCHFPRRPPPSLPPAAPAGGGAVPTESQAQPAQ